MPLHQITTSLEDKLIKIDKIFSNEKLDYISNKSYAYCFNYKDYKLVIPCSVIFKAFYSYRKPLLEAIETGNLRSMYYEFKYDKKSKIDIFTQRYHSRKLIPYICQLIIDKNVYEKVIYIYFQKIKNHNKLNLETILCFLPYYGTFDLDASYYTIHHPIHKEICIVYKIDNNMLLSNYEIDILNVHYKDSKKPSNIYEPIDKNKNMHKSINFEEFIYDLTDQKILPTTALIKEQVPFPLNSQLYDAIVIFNFCMYEFKLGYLLFIFSEDSNEKENLLYLYINDYDKTPENLKLEIIDIIAKIKDNQHNLLKGFLSKSYHLERLSISEYHMTRAQINSIMNRINIFCDNINNKD